MGTIVGCTQGDCGNRTKRIYKVDHPFWVEGNLDREILAKQIALDIDSVLSALAEENVAQFKCQIAGCNRWFVSTLAYEGHYNTSHRYSCNTCGRMFPIARLLELHVLETHDTLFGLLAKKQNMYECLVAGCEAKFASDKDREKHLIDLHHYPREFAFHYRRRKRYIRRKKCKGKSKSNKSKKDASKLAEEEQQRTEDMIDSAADLLSNMEMDRGSSSGGSTKPSTPTSSTTTEDQAGAAPVNPFTAQLLVGESGRVYACKVPDSFSFGRRGRGGQSSADSRGGRGRGGARGGARGRGRGGRGRGRGQGHAQDVLAHHPPPDTTTHAHPSTSPDATTITTVATLGQADNNNDSAMC